MENTERVTNSYAIKVDVLCFTVLITFISSLSLLADPKPGDIFREYHFADGNGVHLCPQGATRDSAAFTISVADLKGAVRAELTGLLPPGHIGTSERRIRINNGKAFDAPASELTVANKERYF